LYDKTLHNFSVFFQIFPPMIRCSIQWRYKKKGGKSMSEKITIIGAGSLVFARTLFTDLMSIPELRNFEYIFTDINADNLEKTRALCQRDIDSNGINKTIIATTNRREA